MSDDELQDPMKALAGVPLRFFRSPRPRVASGLMVLLASALYGMFFLLTLYMQVGLAWSPLHAGVAYVASESHSLWL